MDVGRRDGSIRAGSQKPQPDTRPYPSYAAGRRPFTHSGPGRRKETGTTRAY